MLSMKTAGALFAALLTAAAAPAGAGERDPGRIMDAARDLSLKGQFSDSRRLYRKVIEEFPRELHDQALFWLAYAYEAEGASKEAAPLYDQLAKDFPASVYADDALRKLAAIRSGERDFAAAAAALRSLVDRYGESPYANGAKLELGDLYGYQLGQFAAAAAAYGEYRPGEAERAEIAWKIGFFQGNQDYEGKPLREYLLAVRQRDAGEADAAETTLKKLIVDYPKSAVIDDALVLLGRNEIDRAVRLRLDNPVLGGEARERFLGHYRSAAEYFRQVMRDSPPGEAAAEAQYCLGLIYDWDRLGGLNDFEKARSEYRAVTERYPGTYWSKKAGERLAYIDDVIGR